jgi:hypothetical protein
MFHTRDVSFNPELAVKIDWGMESGKVVHATVCFVNGGATKLTGEDAQKLAVLVGKVVKKAKKDEEKETEPKDETKPPVK